MTSTRQRLPHRRHSITETPEVGGQVCEATVGFDEHGRPREVFLAGAKEGNLLAAILADAAAAISVALRHGVPVAALAKSVARLPARLEVPYDLDQPQAGKLPTSPIGVALDLLRGFEIDA